MVFLGYEIIHAAISAGAGANLLTPAIYGMHNPMRLPAPNALPDQWKPYGLAGDPLAGVSIGALVLLKPYTAEQPHLGLIVFNGGTHSDQDGRYTLHVDSRPIRLFSQPRVGSVLYEMKISPELHLDDSKPLVSGMDFVLNPIPTSATIKGVVTPMRTSTQTDTITLSQILTIDGDDYAKWWAQQDPTLSGSVDIFQFPLQPGGVYSLSLHRYEANNQQSGEAIATITLPEGSTAEVLLTVK